MKFVWRHWNSPLFWNSLLMICNSPVLLSHSKNIRMSTLISTSNQMFKREIWDKCTEFTFLKFWSFPSKTREISKFQKMNEVNFPQISRINMWFLVNHMLQALTCFTREISKFQKSELGKFISNFPLKHMITSTNS